MSGYLVPTLSVFAPLVVATIGSYFLLIHSGANSRNKH